MDASETLVGQQIGRFFIKERLDEGGMAYVYLAEDTGLKRDVCLKTLKPTVARNLNIRERFQREAMAMARLTDTRIIQVYETGLTPDNVPYFAMEYVTGGSLANHVAELKKAGKALSTLDILKLMREVAAALAVVHREGMVHRDLKPANILLKDDGSPVLADLGIVAINDASRLTITGQLPGTPYYMSPEQFREEAVDGRSDIYAVGVILYELLAGVRPFTGADNMAVMHQHLTENPAPLAAENDSLSPATTELVHTCLQKDPTMRYQSAAQLTTALDRAIAAETQKSWYQPFLYRAGRLAQLYGGWLLGVVGVAGIIWLGWTTLAPEEPGVPTIPATRIPTATPTDTAVAPIEAAIRTTPQGITTAVPPTPTETPTPSITPTATPTATPTTTASPTVTPTPGTVTPSPTTPGCLPSPGDRWSSAIYAEFGAQLGCAFTTPQYPLAAYQIFNKGLMVWRGDTDIVYILYYHDGAFSTHDVSDVPTGYENAYPDLLKSAFGYLYNSSEAISQNLQDPKDAEMRANEFVVQNFAGGIIFYFVENNANTYVLLYESGLWFTRQE